MADVSLPKTWREALPYIVWGILVFSFGLEGVVKLLAGEFLISGIAFALMLGIAALALWTPKLKAIALDVRWIVAALFVALLALAAVPYVEQRRFPYAYLLGIGPNPPAAPNEFTPTSLRLQFNSLGARPHEIDAKNIKWVLTPTEEFISLKEGNTCPSPSILGTPNLTFCTPTPPTAVTARNWFLFLSFSAPIAAKKIELDSHGAKLPKWDEIELTDKQAVLRFHDNLPPMILDIRASN
jgi:hypothetical protein